MWERTNNTHTKNSANLAHFMIIFLTYLTKYWLRIVQNADNNAKLCIVLGQPFRSNKMQSLFWTVTRLNWQSLLDVLNNLNCFFFRREYAQHFANLICFRWEKTNYVRLTNTSNSMNLFQTIAVHFMPVCVFSHVKTLRKHFDRDCIFSSDELFRQHINRFFFLNRNEIYTCFIFIDNLLKKSHIK